MVLAQDDLICREDLELRSSEDENLDEFSIPLNTEELKENKRLARERAVEPVEKAFVYAALERNNWNVTKAAEETGMLRPNFQAMLKKLGVSIKNHNAN